MRISILKSAAAFAILLGTAAFATPASAGPEVCPAGIVECNPGGGAGGHQHQHQQQQQLQVQGQSNSQNVTYSSREERAPVSTADAAPLITGEDTCMGSSAIGGQGVGFGLSIGTTWTDENCQRLKNARQLSSLGFSRAAMALICIDEDVQTAMRAAGTPCPYMGGEDHAAAEAPREQQLAQVREEETHVAENRTSAIPAPILSKPAARSYVPMQPINK